MMYKVISILFLSLTFYVPVSASAYSLEDLGEKLFAVHATDIFPEDGIAYAGLGAEEERPENFPNFRCTLHFAVGELVRPLGDDWCNWEEKKYAIVTPLKSLFPQLVNLNCYDTFIIGNFVFDEETILVAPEGTMSENTAFPIYEYSESISLREAVDALIALRGGWKATMLCGDLEDEYPPAMIDGININSHEHFQPILELLPHLSLGLRWEPHHGEAWRLAEVELLFWGLYYEGSYEIFEERTANLQFFREKLLHHYEALSKTYLEAPMLCEASKKMLLERLELMDAWVEWIDDEIAHVDGKRAI